MRTLPGASMEKIKSVARIVVCDAGPLIHLDEVGCVNLLADFAQVLVPDAVWVEVARHRPAALQHPDVPLRRTSLGDANCKSSHACLPCTQVKCRHCNSRRKGGSICYSRTMPQRDLLPDILASQFTAPSAYCSVPFGEASALPPRLAQFFALCRPCRASI